MVSDQTLSIFTNSPDYYHGMTIWRNRVIRDVDLYLFHAYPDHCSLPNLRALSVDLDDFLRFPPASLVFLRYTSRFLTSITISSRAGYPEAQLLDRLPHSIHKVHYICPDPGIPPPIATGGRCPLEFSEITYTAQSPNFAYGFDRLHWLMDGRIESGPSTDKGVRMENDLELLSLLGRAPNPEQTDSILFQAGTRHVGRLHIEEFDIRNFTTAPDDLHPDMSFTISQFPLGPDRSSYWRTHRIADEFALKSHCLSLTELAIGIQEKHPEFSWLTGARQPVVLETPGESNGPGVEGEALPPSSPVASPLTPLVVPTLLQILPSSLERLVVLGRQNVLCPLDGKSEGHEVLFGPVDDATAIEGNDGLGTLTSQVVGGDLGALRELIFVVDPGNTVLENEEKEKASKSELDILFSSPEVAQNWKRESNRLGVRLECLVLPVSGIQSSEPYTSLLTCPNWIRDVQFSASQNRHSLALVV